MTPTINKRKCPAQNEICKAIPACPTGAIIYVEDEQEPLRGKIVIDAALCNDMCRLHRGVLWPGH